MVVLAGLCSLTALEAALSRQPMCLLCSRTEYVTLLSANAHVG